MDALTATLEDLRIAYSDACSLGTSDHHRSTRRLSSIYICLIAQALEAAPHNLKRPQRATLFQQWRDEQQRMAQLSAGK